MAEYINKSLVLAGLNLRLLRLKNEHESADKIAELENIIGAISETETEDVIERSTMEILCNEYLNKCNCCDECCAEYFCIENQLRAEKRDCINNLITYFTKRNIGE